MCNIIAGLSGAPCQQVIYDGGMDVLSAQAPIANVKLAAARDAATRRAAEAAAAVPRPASEESGSRSPLSPVHEAAGRALPAHPAVGACRRIRFACTDDSSFEEESHAGARVFGKAHVCRSNTLYWQSRATTIMAWRSEPAGVHSS